MNYSISIPRYEGMTTGLPEDGRVITFSNSERTSFACRHKWYFRHIEQLDTKATSRPLRYGTAWGNLLQNMYDWWACTDGSVWPPGAEDICAWCSNDVDPSGCIACDETGLGVIRRTTDNWAKFMLPEDVAKDILVLRRAFEGYLKMYGRVPDLGTEIVGTEVWVSRVILNPKTGKPYRPKTWVVPHDGGWRLAKAGEARLEGAKTVTWPWYQVGALDHLVRTKATGICRVGEHKSSGSPRTYAMDVVQDPQTTGYVWLSKACGYDVSGYVYDVASSVKQQDPKPLKGGGLSKSGSAKTPTWRYRAAVKEHGLDMADYEEHIQTLKYRVDKEVYVRIEGTVGDQELNRYALEVFKVVKEMSQLRRSAAVARDIEDIYAEFPRSVSICKRPGGYCSFRSICQRDEPQTRESLYDAGIGQTWRVKAPDGT